jgi:hypothetical protein
MSRRFNSSLGSSLIDGCPVGEIEPDRHQPGVGNGLRSAAYTWAAPRSKRRQA